MIAPTRISIDAVHAPVYYVESVTSTLDLAASLLADTATPTPHLTTIIADRQSAGRGRLGRSWITPPGQALLASTIISLPVSLHADALGWIVHACALSVRHALAARLEPSVTPSPSSGLTMSSSTVHAKSAASSPSSPRPRPLSRLRSSSATASTSPKRRGLFPLRRPRPCWPKRCTGRS